MRNLMIKWREEHREAEETWDAASDTKIRKKLGPDTIHYGYVVQWIYEPFAFQHDERPMAPSVVVIETMEEPDWLQVNGGKPKGATPKMILPPRQHLMLWDAYEIVSFQ